MLSKNNPIHGLRKRAFYERKWLVETIAAGPPFIGATYSAYKALQSNGVQVEPNSLSVTDNGVDPLILGSVCAWLLVASVIKVLAAKAQDTRDDLAKGHDGIRAALNVVHNTVSLVGKLETAEQRRTLRVTFHRVVPPLGHSEYIEQIVPYVGGNGSEPGRRFSIRSGITGCAIREKAVIVMSRQSVQYEDYLNELVKDWSYTEADAKKMTSDRFSAMAVPVAGRGQDMLGVVYLDSSLKNFFAVDEVQQAVVAACTGVADYIGERYD